MNIFLKNKVVKGRNFFGFMFFPLTESVLQHSAVFVSRKKSRPLCRCSNTLVKSSLFVEFIGAKLRNMQRVLKIFLLLFLSLPRSPSLFSFLPQQPAANEYKVAAVVWNFLKLPSSGELPPCCRIQRGKMSVLPVTHCFIVFPRIALRPFDGARGNKRRFS